MPRGIPGSSPRADYGSVRPQVVELLEGGVASDGSIARRVGCSRQYVGQVRAELTGIGRSIGEGAGHRAPTGDGVVDLDGGSMVIGDPSEGRVLLTLHEHRMATIVVGLTETQLTEVIERAIAVRELMRRAA